MKAISTRYLGPTNTKGERIVAFDMDGNRTTIGYRHELSTEDAHRAAAEALCAKMRWPIGQPGWPARLISGSIKGGYVFVWESIR